VRCPYCTTEIDDAALACPHCTRDLYLFKPLLQRITDLETRLTVVEQTRIAAELSGEALVEVQEETVTPRIRELAARIAIPLLLLLAAHLLITVIYDFNTLYLRIVSLLIPLPFGFLLTANAARRLTIPLFAAVSTAALAVLGMSALTGWVDHTAILPADLREWREFIEYAASIAFSYTTGIVLGNISRLRQRAKTFQQREGLSLALAHLVTNGATSTLKLQKTIKQFNDVGSTLTAASTTAAALYTGLQGFLK
jgi:hypothetical protein